MVENLHSIQQFVHGFPEVRVMISNFDPFTQIKYPWDFITSLALFYKLTQTVPQFMLQLGRAATDRASKQIEIKPTYMLLAKIISKTLGRPARLLPTTLLY